MAVCGFGVEVIMLPSAPNITMTPRKFTFSCDASVSNLIKGMHLFR